MLPMEETTTEVALDVLSIVAHAAFGFAAGALLSIFLGAIVRLIVRRRRHLAPFSRRLKLPSRILLIILGVGLGVLVAMGWPARTASVAWLGTFLHAWTILLILSGAYLLTGVINAIQDSVVASRSGAEETTHARRVRTQTQVITRVGVALVWLLSIAGVLLTFEQFRAIGASMLASAGLLSIVAGLAAQSSLANIFAGVQLAFTDALRVGDLVIVDDHWGTIEEITLTYVVVASWDGRRWIVPSTVFISKTFENWTRRDPQLLGTVELDLDWLVPVEAMRIELQRIVRASDLWDGRRVNLQVTDATGGHVQVRATVSAGTSGDLWDLRCYVREELIAWVQEQAVYALPRIRLEPEPTPAPSVEEREKFVERTKQAWEAEKSDETTQELDMSDVFDDEGPLEPLVTDHGPRSWLQAIRDRRAATREVGRHRDMDELIASVVRSDGPAPAESGSDGDTATLPRVETTDGRGDSLSPSARIFSGSPEADELNRKYAGPSREDLEERKRLAVQRERNATPQADDADDAR